MEMDNYGNGNEHYGFKTLTININKANINSMRKQKTVTDMASIN